MATGGTLTPAAAAYPHDRPYPNRREIPVDFSEQGEPVAGTTTEVEDPKRATGWEAQPPHGASGERSLLP